MTNYRWSTQYNPIKVTGEINNEPSLTRPNEAMSIREIMVRFTRGLPIDQKVPLYEEDQFLPDVRHMDLADVQTLREQVAQDIENKKAKVEQEHKENITKKELQAQEAKKLERQALLKELKELGQS